MTDDLFIAIPLPADAATALDQRLTSLREQHADEATWVRPEGWHVTLAFLGAVDQEEVAGLVEAMRTAITVLDQASEGQAEGDEVASPVGGDPNAAGPGVPAPGGQSVDDLRLQRAVSLGNAVALAVTNDGWLNLLHAALVDALSDLGHEPRREFRPHLTVARMHGDRSDSGTIVGALGHGWKPVVWRPETIDLYRSQLGDGPARYQSLASVPLPTS